MTRTRPEMYGIMNLATAFSSGLHGVYAVLAILNGTLSGFGCASAIVELGLGAAFGYLALRGRRQRPPD